ncbi:MAG: hypothetical protein WBY28_05235 [Nitrososphaeraceae archaeon]
MEQLNFVRTWKNESYLTANLNRMIEQVAVNAGMTFAKGFKRSWLLLNSKCGSARLFVPLHEQDHSGQCPWLVNNKHLRA